MSPSGAAPRRGRSPRRRTKRQIPALTSQAMDGSPEGRVPLALPRVGAARRAGERNGRFQHSHRRRTKRQFPALTRVRSFGKERKNGGLARSPCRVAARAGLQ